MTLEPEHSHITMRENAVGRRTQAIAGTRIHVAQVLRMLDEGDGLDPVAGGLHLTREQVEAAIAYRDAFPERFGDPRSPPRRVCHTSSGRPAAGR